MNVGRHGVTTSAGIPGTGLSWRQRVGHPGTMLGIALLIAALVFGAWRNGTIDRILHPAAVAQVSARDTGAGTIIANAKPVGGFFYVHRDNSVLRAEPSKTAPALKHEHKGDQVTLLALSDGWAKVQDGDITGWMRASVLKNTPPE